MLLLPLRFNEARAAEAGSDSAAPLTVALQERTVPWIYMNWGIGITPQNERFNKEPNLEHRTVYRGSFAIADSDKSLAGMDTLKFIWDYTQGKLYLDLNQNGDLTDDNVLTCPNGVNPSGQYYNQTFPSIDWRSSQATNHLVGELYLYKYGDRLNGSFGVKSLWEGKFSSGGKDWQIGVLEQFPFSRSSLRASYLLLRPWSSRDVPFTVNNGSLDAVNFPRKLFFGGNGYAVKWAAHDKLELTPQQPALANVKVTGRFLQRVCLTAHDNYTVVLDKPGTVVRVPMGKYSQCSATLGFSNTTAYLDSRSGIDLTGTGLTVLSNGTALLALGGPLTNSVTITRRGHLLNLQYELVGPGGRKYQLSNVDRSKPPTFEIFKGDTRIASGKFEFG